jgi:hypothetical protein
MMTSTVHPTPVPIRHRHLGRNVAIGAAAVALGVGAAFLIEDWTASTTVTETRSVVVDMTNADLLPATPDAAEHWVVARQAAHEQFCQTTPVAPDAIEACLNLTR